MRLEDLLVSYKQVQAPKNDIFAEPIKWQPIKPVESIVEPKKVESKKVEPVDIPVVTPVVKPIVKSKLVSKITGSKEFELAYDLVLLSNPDAAKYRPFLTKMALKESGFIKNILNRAGAPAFGYFLFMLDGKKYNNISHFANTDVETFRNDAKILINAAIKLAKSFEKGFSKKDLKLAELKGFTKYGLLAGAWLGGNRGVSRYLAGEGNASDRKWDKKNGKGTDVATRIREFNFKDGGSLIKKVNLSKANFMTRLLDENRLTISDWEFPEKVATHKLGYADIDNGKAIVFPTVLLINGLLHDFSDPKYKHGKWDALDNAEASNDTIILSSEEAKLFTNSYKKYYPKFDKY